jgi:hypothetical protein
VEKLFSFMWSHLSVLSLSSPAIWVLFRKSFPMPTVSYISFRIQVLY